VERLVQTNRILIASGMALNSRLVDKQAQKLANECTVGRKFNLIYGK